MPEQITPLSILYLQLHGAGTAVATVLFLYLLLCRGKAIAPTSPSRLRLSQGWRIESLFPFDRFEHMVRKSL